MNKNSIKAVNMAAFKMALSPMQVIEADKKIYIKDERSDEGFIHQSTVNKVSGACYLFGFSGYYITDSADYGLCFRIY